MNCPKCGAQNATGDAFCGTCGAFMEFAAEEAAPGTEAPVDAATAPVAATPATPAELPAPAPAPVAPGVASAPLAAPGLAATGPVCATCGRQNPAGRTFCISCGEKLAAGGARAAAPLPVASPSAPRKPAPAPPAGPAPVVQAAPPAPPAPAARQWEFPTAPTQPVPTPLGVRAGDGASPGAAADRGSRRGRGVLAIIGLVVIVGIVVTGGAIVLMGKGGGTGISTPAPTDVTASSGSPTSEASPGDSSTPGASPSSPEVTPAPTFPAGSIVGLKLTGAKASSQLSASAAAKLVIDGDQTTAWRTGTPTPADQWIQVTFAPAAVSRIEIWAGWTRTKDLYYGNDRPHNVTIRFTGGDAFPVALNDVFGPQKIDLPPEVGAIGVTSLQITILDWYPAKKTAAAGSPTKQAAISEIRLYGIATTP